MGGGEHGREACMAGGRAWEGGMCGGGMHGREGMHGQGGMHGRMGMHGEGACVAWQILWDKVNEQAVRILLECILVIS